MNDMSKNFKQVWLKSMEAISDTASRIATNTKYKINEMNIVNRRAEILKDFGAKSYELWQKGEQFPAELDVLLSELHQLECELSKIRAEKEAAKPAKEVQPASETAEEQADESVGETEEQENDGFETVPMMEEDEEVLEEISETEPADDEVPTIKVEE